MYDYIHMESLNLKTDKRPISNYITRNIFEVMMKNMTYVIIFFVFSAALIANISN